MTHSVTQLVTLITSRASCDAKYQEFKKNSSDVQSLDEKGSDERSSEEKIFIKLFV